MDKLQPPTPEPEITPSEPVEEVPADRAVSMLPELPDEQQQDLAERADQWVDQISALNPHSQEFSAQVDALGAVARRTFERTSGTSSRFMQQSLRDAKESGGGQESVSKSLSQLRTTMEDLAPKEDTFGSKALSFLPGKKSAKRYFRSYESNQKQLDEVLAALGRGQEMLQRDNAELSVERRALWEDLGALQKASSLLGLLDERTVRRADGLRGEGKPDAADALERDVLFAVRQRRQDVATQIAVTVQAYLAMGLIEDNNTKLAQGVDRARTTTVTALRTAVITAQALENQKLVLDQIDAVNRTTDSLIDRTSQMLADNTLKIQEQAATSGVSPETLQKAFDNLFTTMDGIDSFRTQANANFLTTVNALEQQVQRSQPYLERMQQEGGDEHETLESVSDLLEIED
ncbi:toxic anion resistance protein [Brachybacterium alimentarium]|uniref:Tellurite resistance protein n=1 Tax=Brachybacterium alimentarium TaxID=47845 RepID=A0A2A3YGQ8_9MICO|nr:toxic anion resistance protein [Brachybacterium alimentarium]PCC38500.1 tellurite resistance protein [Brachybacterium alimentarium]RCS81540.1 toxic anion resistance protein [Brachybacterium alimentarium]